jgi:hypothetical protein
MTLRSAISVAGKLTHRPRLGGFRARALLICQRPEAYAPSRVRGAAAYLLESVDATEDEEHLASEAIVHTMDFPPLRHPEHRDSGDSAIADPL